MTSQLPDPARAATPLRPAASNLAEAISAAIKQACDVRDAEVAKRLLLTLECMLNRLTPPPALSDPALSDHAAVACLAAAHERPTPLLMAQFRPAPWPATPPP